MHHKQRSRAQSKELSFRSCLIMPLLSLLILPVMVGGLLMSDVKQVSAQGTCTEGSSLVISEIMYEPDNSSQEWIEIYNSGSTLIDIEDYVLSHAFGTGTPSDPIGNFSVPAGETVILVNSAGATDSNTVTTFEAEWGTSTVQVIPLNFGFNLNDGGDSIEIWESADHYNDSTGTADACDHTVYGLESPGKSIYLIDLTADNTQPANWRTSSLCQGTPLFTSFESTSGDIGSPNDTIGGGNCFPTITTSTPYTGTIGVPVALATIDVTFSEPISIMSDPNAISLLCGGESIDFTTTPTLPATSQTMIQINVGEALADGGSATGCTLNFNKGFVGDETTFPAAFPDDFELELKFTTEGANLVELASFGTAKATNGSVAIAWITAAEIDNAGFNLYRSNRPNGPWISLNDQLIAAKGSAFESAAYRFIDDNGAGYYMLEDVDVSGVTTQHGPITATDSVANASQGSYALFLPMLQR